MQGRQTLGAALSAAVLGVVVGGCASTPMGDGGQPRDTGTGRAVGEAVGAEVAREHGILGQTLGGIFGQQAERAAASQAQQPAVAPTE